jgi:hypothetical protein
LALISNGGLVQLLNNCGFLSLLIFQNHLELLVPGSWGKNNQRTIGPNYFKNFKELVGLWVGI